MFQSIEWIRLWRGGKKPKMSLEPTDVLGSSMGGWWIGQGKRLNRVMFVTKSNRKWKSSVQQKSKKYSSKSDMSDGLLNFILIGKGKEYMFFVCCKYNEKRKSTHKNKSSNALQLLLSWSSAFWSTDKVFCFSTEMRQWTKHPPALVAAAVEAVESRMMTLNLASDTFGMARSTLQDYVRRHRNKTELKVGGRQPYLTSREEANLVKYLVYMQQNNWGLNTRQVNNIRITLSHWIIVNYRLPRDG